MSNRNFDSSIITQRRANKAVAKNVLSVFGEPYNFQPQTSNFSASVMNEVAQGNSQFVLRGDTCTVVDLGCPCIGESPVISSTIPTPPFVFTNGQAQWATRIGSLGLESKSRIVSDSNGFIYIAGEYASNPVTFNNFTTVIDGSINVTRYGDLSTNPPLPSSDIFLAKYDSSGQVIWVTRIGTRFTESDISIATDGFGNIYIAGTTVTNPATPVQFYDASDVSGTTINVSLYGNLGIFRGPDLFLAKYNSLGKVQWATRIDGIGSETTPYISADSNGNVYISGTFSGGSGNPVNFNNFNGRSGTTINFILSGTLDSSIAGLNDIFLAKYNTTGILQWVTYIGGTQPESNNSLSLDTSGNIYISGQYNSISLTVNSFQNIVAGSVNVSKYGDLSLNGNNDIFLAKYNSSGQVQWVTRIDGSANETAPIISSDLNGNIYITGQYGSNSVTINDVSGVSGTTINVSKYGDLSNNSSDDIFLAKYNSSGNVQWVTNIGGSSSEAVPFIATDSSNNIYITGQYASNPLTINDTSGVSGTTINVSKYGDLSNNGFTDIFLVKYNSLGKAQWVTRIDGNGSETVPSVTAGSSGSLYVTGTYSSNPLTFNNFNGLSGATVNTSSFGSLSNIGSNDIFLAKYTT
jgi:hypothetical protein